MLPTLFTWAVVTARTFLVGPQITVEVCNLANLSSRAVEHAESEAAYLFGTTAVEIHWVGCEGLGGAAMPGTVFVVRLRGGAAADETGPTSLETMGRAYLNSEGSGQMVDVYYGAIQQFAALYSTADIDQVLGCTIVHELGHLFIGPGHRPNGLMRAAWGKEELDAMQKRHLKFSRAEQADIRCRLKRLERPNCQQE